VSAIEAREACASTIIEVTDTATGAIATSLVSVPIKRVSTRRTLLKLASRAAVASVAEATDVLHGIPRGGIGTSSFVCEMLLGPASTTVITVVGTGRTLACDTIVAREALARAVLAVASALVGTLHPRMQVVGIDDITYPSEIAGARAQRAVRTSPFGLAVETSEALAVAVLLAGPVVAAVVLTQTPVTVATLVPGDLPPALDGVRRCGGGSSLTIRFSGRTGSREFIGGTCSGIVGSSRTVRIGRTHSANSITINAIEARGVAHGITACRTVDTSQCAIICRCGSRTCSNVVASTRNGVSTSTWAITVDRAKRAHSTGTGLSSEGTIRMRSAGTAKPGRTGRC